MRSTIMVLLAALSWGQSGCSANKPSSDAEFNATLSVPIADPEPSSSNTVVEDPFAGREDLHSADALPATTIRSDIQAQLDHDAPPAPPAAFLLDSPIDASSARDVVDSVTRVLRSTLLGEQQDEEPTAEVSVVRSIGRALNAGFWEAMTSVEPQDAESAQP